MGVYTAWCLCLHFTKIIQKVGPYLGPVLTKTEIADFIDISVQILVGTR